MKPGDLVHVRNTEGSWRFYQTFEALIVFKGSTRVLDTVKELFTLIALKPIGGLYEFAALVMCKDGSIGWIRAKALEVLE